MIIYIYMYIPSTPRGFQGYCSKDTVKGPQCKENKHKYH